MKFLKALLSLTLVLALVLSFTGCHKKNETALEVNGIKFTSAMYSYALLNADTEARNKVAETLTEEQLSAEVDYFAQKIDDVDFETWVENRAVEILTQYAAYETLFKENSLTVDAETLTEIKNYCNYYYPSYQAMFEPNGIGAETYEKMLIYDSYVDKYFDFLYNKDGSKAIPAEDIEKAFNESYRIAFVLQTDVTNMDEEQTASEKKKLEDALNDIKGGKSVVEVYNAFNGLTAETEKQGTGTPAKEENEVVNVVADPEFDSSYGVDFWKDIKDIKAKDGKVIEVTADTQKYLCMVYVIENEEDNKYLENMDSAIRWVLKSEEYKADVAEYAKTLKVVKNNYAIKAFKVKDIYYGE